MKLDSSLLFHLIKDAVRPYSESFHIRDTRNPITFRLNEGKYSVQVSYLHDTMRRNAEEIRIQLTRKILEVQSNRRENNYNIAFIGFFPGGRTFVAWDPRHVFSLQASKAVSVYARSSQQTEVANNLIGFHKFRSRYLKETSTALALESCTLGFYLENINSFHCLSDVEALLSFVKQNYGFIVDKSNLNTNKRLTLNDSLGRKKFIYNRKSYPRDPKFREQVLHAYAQSCCVCGRQLSIVQAAHIIPNNHPDSSNTVNNGLALCIEHHKLYDDGLLLPGPNRTMVFNNNRAAFLREINQAIGLNQIANYDQRTYTIPKDPIDQPLDEYLERGIRIRLAQ